MIRDHAHMRLELTTDRLLLLPTCEDDLDIATEMFTDPDVLRYAGGAMSEDTVRADMVNWTRRGGNGCIGIWTIHDRQTREKYGSVALLPMPVEEDDTDYSLVVPNQMPDAEIEVGYFLKRSAWGRGYATEVCKRILRFAFEESPLEQVVATIEEKNVASRNVLLKAGFVYRGMMRAYGENSPNYRISRDEWLRLARAGR